MNPFGPHVAKYWDRRYDLFSRFDQGIQLDEESLFSVKPEAVALQIAARLPYQTLVDATCGAGGLTIAGARLGKRVVAIDVDPNKIAMCRNNARVYDVFGAIDFRVADARDLTPGQVPPATLYLDPPWGGPEYYKKDNFCMADFAFDPMPLIESFLDAGRPVALSVPINFDVGEIAKLVKDFAAFPSFAWGRTICSTIVVTP